MFDPTIYDNLKVVLEGSVYDLDLSGAVRISGRQDQIDLSTMSRLYQIEFRRLQGAALARMRLSTTLTDLSSELLQRKGEKPGCVLEIHFELPIRSVDKECRAIEAHLKETWGDRPNIVQTLSYVYGKVDQSYANVISLNFGRKLDENQVDDLPSLTAHTLESLEKLDSMKHVNV